MILFLYWNNESYIIIFVIYSGGQKSGYKKFVKYSMFLDFCFRSFKFTFWSFIMKEFITNNE